LQHKADRIEEADGEEPLKVIVEAKEDFNKFLAFTGFDTTHRHSPPWTTVRKNDRVRVQGQCRYNQSQRLGIELLRRIETSIYTTRSAQYILWIEITHAKRQAG
jgi:putative alpha-1,2-mannosidase